MKAEFDEGVFLKMVCSHEASAIKSAEAFGKRSQKTADEKNKQEYAQEKNLLASSHEEAIKDLTIKKADVRNRYEKIESELSAIETQLNFREVLDPAFQYLAPAIKTILETGRAESVKEALNLAISDEKDEAERRDRREHERTMEEIANRESARAAEEEMRAFEAQAKARKEREQREYENEMERSRKEREEERELKTATFYHCTECVKYSGCPIARTKRGLTCTAFEQKERFKL